MENVYTIPVSQIDALVKKVDALNKKSVKLRLDSHITFRLTGVQKIERVEDTDYDGNVIKKDVLVENVVLSGDAPKLNGYRLIAVLSQFEGQLLIETVPNESVDVRFRSANPTYCEHCKMARKRSETFIVSSDGGVQTQVGRQCLKDFLGHGDVAGLITWGELFGELDANFRGGWGGGGAPLYRMDEVLPLVCMSVREHGWVSRGVARDDYTKRATADDVLSIIDKRPITWREAATDIDHDHADVVMKFVQNALLEKGRETLNDYEYNLAVVFDREVPVMDTRTAGIACSGIAYYNNATKQRAERESGAASKHIGAVGDKVKIEVEVYSKGFHESMYGTTVRLNMKDAAGNVIVTFGTGSDLWDMEVGEKYTIKGTIKSLDSYNGIEQTMLTRVKLA